MAATSASLWNRHQARIEEVINKNIEVFLPALDPVWQDTIVTSQGVGGQNEIGRDMNIVKVFMGGMNGVVEEGAGQYGDVSLYGDTTTAFGSKIHEQNLTQTWPNPLDGANATPYTLVVPMRSIMTNLMLTIGELQAEATPAFIGEVVTPKLEGFARNLSHVLCNYWYVSQNSSYALCTVTSVAGGGATKSFTFKPNNQATDRFMVGQRIDVIKAAGTARANDTDNNASGGQSKSTRIKLYVNRVDELTNTVEATSDTNVNAWTGQASVANGDLIVNANSFGSATTLTFKGIAGVNSWMKNGADGTNAGKRLLGSEATAGALGGTEGIIDVTVHNEFKSMFVDVAGQPLTEHFLRKVLRGWHRAKNKYGQYIDCLIASDGVWLAYEGTKIGREFIDRTGRLSNINNEGSQTGFKFTFDGRTYDGYTSNYIETGTVYGIRKGGNNWKRYVPPDPQGVSSFDRVQNGLPFKFVASSVTGHSSNRVPIYKAADGNAGSINLFTEGSQLPGMLRMQLVPDQPAGLKLTSVAEDRQYADA